MKKLITIVGNRPHIIKMSMVSKLLQERGYQEIVIHSGQHYDYNMNELFFGEMGIKQPNYILNLTNDSSSKVIAEVMLKVSDIFNDIKPTGILVYGDTNTTLAATLVAVKHSIPIAHVESGPRTYDMSMPEEVNRVLVDHVSKIKFCPDIVSVQNLARENIIEGVFFTGDVMYDSYLYFSQMAIENSIILKTLNLSSQNFIFLTLHRPHNVDTKVTLENIILLLQNMDCNIVFSVHPRTEKNFKKYDLWKTLQSINNLLIVPPLGYLDTLTLINNCICVLTDSGGLQKEAYFAKKYCLVFLNSTPWPQIQDCGWQKVLGYLNKLDVEKIYNEVKDFNMINCYYTQFFGQGNASHNIVDILAKNNFI